MSAALPTAIAIIGPASNSPAAAVAGQGNQGSGGWGILAFAVAAVLMLAVLTVLSFARDRWKRGHL